MLPDAIASTMIKKGGVDRMSVLHASIDTVRRGGTISLSGVYGGMVDPMPMFDLFDKQIQLRMGQANVKRWIEDIMPLLETDEDPLDVDGLATHKLPLAEAPHAYEIFQKKQDGAIKILLQP
jgi:threonine dehydrogenase-like Zn-dependent dehydrogenase